MTFLRPHFRHHHRGDGHRPTPAPTRRLVRAPDGPEAARRRRRDTDTDPTADAQDEIVEICRGGRARDLATPTCSTSSRSTPRSRPGSPAPTSGPATGSSCTRTRATRTRSSRTSPAAVRSMNAEERIFFEVVIPRRTVIEFKAAAGRLQRRCSRLPAVRMPSTTTRGYVVAQHARRDRFRGNAPGPRPCRARRSRASSAPRRGGAGRRRRCGRDSSTSGSRCGSPRGPFADFNGAISDIDVGPLAS